MNLTSYCEYLNRNKECQALHFGNGPCTFNFTFKILLCGGFYNKKLAVLGDRQIKANSASESEKWRNGNNLRQDPFNTDGLPLSSYGIHTSLTERTYLTNLGRS